MTLLLEYNIHERVGRIVVHLVSHAQSCHLYSTRTRARMVSYTSTDDSPRLYMIYVVLSYGLIYTINSNNLGSLVIICA